MGSFLSRINRVSVFVRIPKSFTGNLLRKKTLDSLRLPRYRAMHDSGAGAQAIEKDHF
jgi:hypothetical protein